MGRCPGAHQVNRSLAHVLVMGTPQGFAVDGYDLSLRHLAHRSNPFDEAGLELLGVQHRKDPAEGVMRRDAARQLQYPAEPFLL